MKFERPLPAFFSYSHKDRRDRRHLDDLIDALSEFRDNGDIDKWDDRHIRGGQEWETILLDRARKSRLFLLLITNRFIGSDYCKSELHIARILNDKRLAAIVPVQVEECNWRIDGLRDLQLIRPFDKPVNSSRKDRSWTEVGKRVKEIADDLWNGRYFPPASANREIPVMLPYSIGRDDDQERFRKALAAAPGNKPFVCILTGSGQGQKQFIDWLLREGGPVRKQLGPGSAYNPITIDKKADNDQWIDSGESPEILLDRTLASRAEPPPDTTERNSIAASFHKNPGVTVVRFELNAGQRRACDKSRLDDFLAYWNSWPHAPSAPQVLVFLTVDADIAAQPITGGLWLPLDSISRTAVEAWLDKPEIASQFVTARIKTQLQDVFGESDRLRMEDLAAKILPWLRKYII